jgi:hypothetical protein
MVIPQAQLEYMLIRQRGAKKWLAKFVVKLQVDV